MRKRHQSVTFGNNFPFHLELYARDAASGIALGIKKYFYKVLRSYKCFIAFYYALKIALNFVFHLECTNLFTCFWEEISNREHWPGYALYRSNWIYWLRNNIRKDAHLKSDLSCSLRTTTRKYSGYSHAISCARIIFFSEYIQIHLREKKMFFFFFL